MDSRYRHVRPATVARNALDTLAAVLLGGALAFWFVLYWKLLSPPTLLSLETIGVVVLALVYGLASPLLWSALVPTTPAGQLLQRTQWRTIGFAFIIAG